MTYEATIRGVGVSVSGEGVGAPAVLLAVRAGCPVLVASEVIDAAGRPPGTLRTRDPGQAPGGTGSGSVEIDIRGMAEQSERGDSDPADLDDAVDIDFEDADDPKRTILNPGTDNTPSTPIGVSVAAEGSPSVEVSIC